VGELGQNGVGIYVATRRKFHAWFLGGPGLRFLAERGTRGALTFDLAGARARLPAGSPSEKRRAESSVLGVLEYPLFITM